jgi:hypothetical protein
MDTSGEDGIQQHLIYLQNILLARLVNHADSALFLLMCPIAGMYLIKIFDQAMLHYIILQCFGIGNTTVWDFAFDLFEAGCTIFVGALPRSDSNTMSRTNMQ